MKMPLTGKQNTQTALDAATALRRPTLKAQGHSNRLTNEKTYTDLHQQIAQTHLMAQTIRHMRNSNPAIESQINQGTS